jgi:molybdopterin-guanine dinucleotide biosynthesis protein A
MQAFVFRRPGSGCPDKPQCYHFPVSRAGYVLVGGPGLPEPLCAAYRQCALPVTERDFQGGVRKVTAAYAGTPVVMWPMAELKPFQNVNTPEDWSGYAAE